ncbi:putative replication protein A 70 kDa DNA-binding subunit [Apostichopus japonicus]|uniref:Replication protein A subunit n=1 Tax=Stichopus japonicus TaxID=307972 RepID=A0A2G8KDY3_STIJA|nr:putative replication protein A 70 kDa DNA-binding subunit [Apostichopus japonicus]
MAAQLSAGAIAAIMEGDKRDKPTFQIVACKKMVAANPSKPGDRYRLLLSDGNHNCSVMLATQLELQSHIKLFPPKSCDSSYQLHLYIHCSYQVIVILDATVVASADSVNNEIIGNPKLYQGSSTSNQPTPQGNQSRPVPNNKMASPSGKQGFQSNIQSPVPSSKGSFGGNFSRVGTGLNNNMGSPPKSQPISSLTPYQNRWTIKVRVTNKSDIRTWSNSRGEGKLFSMDLVDQSGEIRATAFKDQVDKFYDVVEKGKVYFLSKGTLKPANKQYTSIQNDYELTFNSETTMMPCEEEDSTIPNVQFDFRSITQLQDTNPDTMVDVIGVAKTAGEVQKVTIKSSSREVSKRDVSLVDDSGKVVNMTLWGKEAEGFDASVHPVVAVKGARLSSFGGRSLSVLMSSIFQINPDIPRAHALKGWYDSEGCRQELQSISESRGMGGGGSTNWCTFKEVQEQNLGSGEKPDYFTAKATILFAKKENSMYMACPSESCNKKVIENGDGTFRCEKCNKDYTEFQHRLLRRFAVFATLDEYVKCNVADLTDNQWITCFQETAEAILGKNANSLGALREQDDAAFNQVFQDAVFSDFIFKMRLDGDM